MNARAVGLLLWAVTFVGITLVQVAWSLATPPFRGLDEHAHAFRADATARGQAAPLVVAGHGDVLAVDPDLVSAAWPVCDAFPDEVIVNCEPLTARDGLELIPSSAASYHPAFYAVVGVASRPFEGTAQLYALRFVSAALCAALLAWAAVLLARGARTPWPVVGLLVALTPTTTYTTTVAAPNGLEVAAAVLVWAALLRLPVQPAGGSGAAWALGVGGVLLCTLRTLGPGWLALIVGTCLAFHGAATYRRVFQQRPAVRWAGAAIAVAAGQSAVWVLANKTNSPAGQVLGSSDMDVVPTLLQPILWLAQVAGAFPARDEIAPPATLAVVFCLFVGLVAAALRGADRRARRTLATVAVLSVAVPLAFTVLTHPQLGYSWQGRYGWPYTLGALLICGLVLDARAPIWRGQGVVAVAVGALSAGATVIGQLHVLAHELRHSPLAGDAAWWQPNPAAVAVLTTFGLLALGLVAGMLPGRLGIGSLPR